MNNNGPASHPLSWSDLGAWTALTLLSLRRELETSLAVQWLRLRASTAGGTDSIPGQGTKIPTCHMARPKKLKKKKKMGTSPY